MPAVERVAAVALDGIALRAQLAVTTMQGFPEHRDGGSPEPSPDARSASRVRR
jgi:hypothetical protein